LASVEKYYQILGISPNATLKDVIRAYREKALQLHPDRNKAPDATQQFILLEEAYKYLRQLKEGKIKPQTGYTQQEEFAKWWAREQENTRIRAQERARMRYQEFLNSHEHKIEMAIDHLTNVLVAIITSLIVFVLPVYLISTEGGTGILLTFIVLAVTSPLTLPVFSQLGMLKESIRQFKPSLVTLLTENLAKRLLGIKYYYVVLLTVANIFILFTIVVNTVLPHITIAIIYAMAILAGFVVCYFSKTYERSHQYFYSLCVAPIIIGLLFALNFTVSFNPHKETHRYVPKNSPYERMEYKKTSAIKFRDNKYSNYYGLRVFYSYDKIKMGNEITYTFENGLLGIRVLKDYEIRWVEDEEPDEAEDF
jgi:hypothetical protein